MVKPPCRRNHRAHNRVPGPIATSRPPRPNQRRSQRSSRLIRRGPHETRRASWRGGIGRPEISNRAVACPPELQVPPKWVRQAPPARRFRTKAARSARCAGGICAVAARCSRQYTGKVPVGWFPRISRTRASWARESMARAIVAERARLGQRRLSLSSCRARPTRAAWRAPAVVRPAIGHRVEQTTRALSEWLSAAVPINPDSLPALPWAPDRHASGPIHRQTALLIPFVELLGVGGRQSTGSAVSMSLSGDGSAEDENCPGAIALRRGRGCAKLHA